MTALWLITTPSHRSRMRAARAVRNGLAPSSDSATVRLTSRRTNAARSPASPPSSCVFRGKRPYERVRVYRPIVVKGPHKRRGCACGRRLTVHARRARHRARLRDSTRPTFNPGLGRSRIEREKVAYAGYAVSLARALTARDDDRMDEASARIGVLVGSPVGDVGGEEFVIVRVEFECSSIGTGRRDCERIQQRPSAGLESVKYRAENAVRQLIAHEQPALPIDGDTPGESNRYRQYFEDRGPRREDAPTVGNGSL